MVVNLKKFIKNGKLKPEHKIKDKLYEKIRTDIYDKDFVNKFYQLAQKYQWAWGYELITIEMIEDHLVNDAYRVIVAEIDYYLSNKEWKSNGWVINGIGSGRLTVRPVEFYEDGKKVYLELEFSTTL